MTDSLLYFPYVNLPATDWTVRALLYYNKVGSIVPIDFFHEPESNYEPFMLELVRQELVIPINPIDRLERPSELNKPFLDFINSDGYRIDEKRTSFLREKSFIWEKPLKPEDAIVYGQTYELQPARVNSQKFNDELMYSITQLGLAKQSTNNWYFIEKVTANYLMAYLASVLGEKLKMLPATDRQFSFNFLKQFREVKSEVNEKRDRILKDLIPMPTKINLKQIQKFKEKNIDNLNRFKNIVEQIALNPIYDNDKLLDEKVRELNFEKEALTARMKETKFGPIFFGTVCGVFGAIQGIAQASTTGAVIGGLPGFATAIYSALKIEKAENMFDQTGLKYLSLVDKRLRLRGKFIYNYNYDDNLII